MEALSSNYGNSERLPKRQEPLPSSEQRDKSSTGNGGSPTILPAASDSNADPTKPSLANLLDNGRDSGLLSRHIRDDLQKLYALGGPNAIRRAHNDLVRSRATIDDTKIRILHFESSAPEAATSLAHDPQRPQQISPVSAQPENPGSGLGPVTQDDQPSGSSLYSAKPNDAAQSVAASSGIPAPKTGSWAAASTVIFAKAGEILPKLRGEQVTWRLGLA